MRPLEALLGSLRSCLDGFPDKRRGINTSYGMADVGMAAFSVFFMQSPSFLAHQRHLAQGHGRSNCASLFGIDKIPSDNHIRDLLDPAAPDLLHPAFAETIAQLGRIDGGLDVFRRLEGRRHRVSLFEKDPLRALLDAQPGQGWNGLLPRHAGGHAGGTRS